MIESNGKIVVVGEAAVDRIRRFVVAPVPRLVNHGQASTD